MIKKVLFVLSCILVLVACSPTQKAKKIRLGINPWPGYEFLYLAGQKGFFKQNGLDVEIVELSSLADVQRVYTQERIDAFGSTVIEAVQAAGITQSPLDIVLIPDFSFGGDVIIGSNQIGSIKDLAGKKVGAEVGSLGMFVLHSALAEHGMSLDDVEVVNVEQVEAQEQMQKGLIDAVVTYPPYSLQVMNLPGNQQIFDTREIPQQVIDTISLRHGVIEDMDTWVKQFHQVWQQTLDYAKQNPKEAHEIMASREGISITDFEDALTGLKIIETKDQAKLLKSTTLKNNIENVCAVLQRAQSVTFECNNISELVRGYGSY